MSEPPEKSGSRNLIVGGSVAGAVLLGVIGLSVLRQDGTRTEVTGASKAVASTATVVSAASPGAATSAAQQTDAADSKKTDSGTTRTTPSSGITFDDPPPLEQWLKGRSVVQVSKDGRGQFQTIQAALDVLKSGQAIEVLDRGPYPESLKIKEPPADTGLFSRVQTVLETPTWEKFASPTSKYEYLNGHQIFKARGFRISGFQFTGKSDPAEITQCAIYSEGSGGLVIEDCQVKFTEVNLDKTAAMSAIRLNGFGTNPAQSIVVRNCALDGSLSVGAWPGMVAAPLGIMHNYIQPMQNGHGVGLSGPQRRVFVRENIVRTDETCTAFSFTFNGQGTELVEVVRNTVVGPGDNRITSQVPAGEVVFQDNVGPAFKLANGAESQKSATENWHVSGNWYSIRPESMPNSENLVFRRLSDPLADVVFLSEDPANPNFARVRATSSGVVAGALPAGSVGAGDWFTTLQQRWSLFGTTASGTPAPQTAMIASTPAATYNLIPALDLKSDRISLANLTGKNEWSVKDGVLAYTSDGKSGKVMFPFLMNDVRAFTIEADVRRTSGTGVFSYSIPVSDSLMTSLDFVPGGNIQLGIAGGKRQTIGQWPKTSPDSGFLKVDVDESANGSGTIVVSVNLKEAARWNGNIRTIGKSLEFHPDFLGQRVFGIFCFKDSFEFKNLKLNVRSGATRPLR